MREKNDAKVQDLNGNNNDFYERFYANQMEDGKSNNTIKVYIREIKGLEEWLKDNGNTLEEVTRFDVQQYMKYLDSLGRSASTIDRVYGVICVLSKFLKRPNIVQDIKRKKKQRISQVEPKALEKNELNTLLRDVEKHAMNTKGQYKKYGLRNLAIVYTLAYTGLRIGELVALDLKDVHLKRGGKVYVRNGKGNQEREVPIPSEARTHLANYLNSRGDEHEALFLSNYGERISVRSAQRIVEKHGIHAHQLRHTYCRTLLKKGYDIQVVAKYAGHESLDITKRYTQPTASELENELDDLYL